MWIGDRPDKMQPALWQHCEEQHQVYRGSMAVGEDEDALTLQEALAFIDACEVDEGASVTSQDSFSPDSSGGSPGTSTGASSDDGDARAAMVQEKLKRKKARNSLAVMRCQRKKKQAVIDLREQVAELEAQLSKLRRRQVSNGARHDLKSGVGALNVIWKDLARRELLERQEAEALNRNLKVALLKQTHLSQALRQLANAGALDHVRSETFQLFWITPRLILRVGSSRQDLALIMRESLPSPLYSAPRKVFSMDYVLADLELAMKKLYIDATHALRKPVATNSSAEYFHMKHKRHHHYGEYINLKRVSTVPMPIERVGEIIWTGMMTYHTDNPSYTLKVGVLASCCCLPNRLELIANSHNVICSRGLLGQQGATRRIRCQLAISMVAFR